MDQPDYLAARLALLHEIGIKTENLVYMAENQQMTGLHRVLRERGLLLLKLSTLDAEQKRDDRQQDAANNEQLLTNIQNKQEEILARSGEAMRIMREGRNQIARQLRDLRSRKRVEHSYTHRWVGTQYSRFDSKLK